MRENRANEFRIIARLCPCCLLDFTREIQNNYRDRRQDVAQEMEGN